MTYTVSHFINGKLVSGSSTRRGDIYNPALGQVIGKVPFANPEDINQAVSAAVKAFPAWAETPPLRRAKILFNFADLLKKNLNDLAKLISQEHGKLLSDAEGSILRGLEVVEFACGIPNLLKGWYSENVGTGIDSYTIKQPLGVCVGITPFNFPAMIPLWMFPMAIACGNTFVLKPSEKDPSCALRFAELMQEAGLPDGVLNVIHGDKEAVDELLTHPEVSAISFVGSTPVAEAIQQTAIKHGKRVQAFGGAKNHAVVMPDADLDQTADAIVGAAFGSAGERCMALSVAMVIGDQLADTFIQKLIPRINKLKVGPCTHPAAEMGPLISKGHWEKVRDYIAIGIQEGAELVIDGRHHKIPQHEEGYFMGACLFDKVQPTMRIYREEIFGPVLSVARVPDLSSALQLINAHEFGNGTAIFTQDGHTARQFASQVKVGMVGINVPIPVPVAYHAFGGWKRSIFADIHMHGTESVSFYTRLKTITSRWPQGKSAGIELMMPTNK